MGHSSALNVKLAQKIQKILSSSMSYHIKTNQINRIVNQINGFYMIKVFTERNFQIDYSYYKSKKSKKN